MGFKVYDGAFLYVERDGMRLMINVPAAKLALFQSKLEVFISTVTRRMKLAYINGIAEHQQPATANLTEAALFEAAHNSDDANVIRLRDEILQAKTFIDEARSLQTRFEDAHKQRVIELQKNMLRELDLVSKPSLRRKRTAPMRSNRLETPNTSMSIDHASVDSSQDIESKTLASTLHIGGPTNATTELESISRTASQISVKSRVLARWDSDGLYYPGRVARLMESGYAIRFDDGDEQVCKKREVILLDTSIPTFKQGFYYFTELLSFEVEI